MSLPRTRIFLVLLLACTELLISAPKIITFLPNLQLGYEKVPLESNPIPYPEYLHASVTTFFANLTAPTRQFSKVELLVLVIVGLNL